MVVQLAEVARAAGVSLAAAQDALNHDTPARERVERAARVMGLLPPATGQTARRGIIGVVPPGAYGLGVMTRGAYARDFLSGVADVCDEMHADLCLISGLPAGKAERINSPSIRGLILSGPEDAELIEPARRNVVSFVVMDVDAGPAGSSVQIDDRDGARQAARHLVGLGHRRFAIVTVLRHDGEAIFHAGDGTTRQLSTGLGSDRERVAGFLEVLADAGIRPGDVPIMETFSESGSALLLERAPEATAVFACSDELALDLLAAAHQRTIRVPRDLSVVGFDDIPSAGSAEPALTTIVQPTVEKGRAAARMLFEPGPPIHVVLPVNLIVRNSTAPPRS